MKHFNVFLPVFALCSLFLTSAFSEENDPPSEASVAGGIVAWGSDLDGQASPPPGWGYTAVAGGSSHSLALRSDGRIVGWGSNTDDLGIWRGQATVPEGHDFVAIAAGSYHSLALREDGSIVGWGSNQNGEATPPEGNDFIAIAAGYGTSLALKEDGSIVFFGSNWDGQNTPPEGNDYIAIALRGSHFLALRQEGSIVGWGHQMYDESSFSYDPFAPPDGNNFVSIAAGSSYGLALREDGSIVGWGSYDEATTPEGNDFVAIAAGSGYSLAHKEDGTMVAWGSGAVVDEVPEGGGFLSIAAGDFHAIALREPPAALPDFRVESITLDPVNFAVGEAVNFEVTVVNQGTASGDGGLLEVYAHQPAPASAEDPGDWSVAVGSLAVWETATFTGSFEAPAPAETKTFRTVVNRDGTADELDMDNNQSTTTYTMRAIRPVVWPLPGIFSTTKEIEITTTTAGAVLHYTTDGSEPTTASPVWPGIPTTLDLPLTLKVLAFKDGMQASELITVDYLEPAVGRIFGWGDNNRSQADVPPGSSYVAVSAGGEHSLALRSDGSIEGWGNNMDPFRSEWTGQATPPEGQGFVAIAAGGYHSLALGEYGEILAWGWNEDGQVDVPEGHEFVAIAAGAFHSLALKADGSIAGWGWNWVNQATPPAGNGFVAIAAGDYHSLALKEDGSIVGWGSNQNGQSTPPEGNDFVAIAAGSGHSLALRDNGSIVVLGFGTPPEGNDFVAVAGAGPSSIALREDGSMVIFGDGPVADEAPEIEGLFRIAGTNGGVYYFSHALVLQEVTNSLPDFRVESISLNPVNVAVGETVNFEVTVVNQGTAIGDGELLEVYAHQADLAGEADPGDWSVAVGPLAVWETATFTGSFEAPAAAETKTFRAVVNRDGTADELDMDNNQSTTTYTMRAIRPVVWPLPGIFSPTKEIEITTATTGAALHYTTDGSEPTTASPVWPGIPTTLDLPLTIKVKAFKEGMQASELITVDYALPSVGQIVGWGDDADGRATPVSGIGYSAVAAGGSHSLALRNDGRIVGWGSNTDDWSEEWIGQATPPEGNDFVAIAAGGLGYFGSHSLALRQDGSLLAWGSDSNGQVSSLPTGNDFVAIASGWRHSLALRTDGSITGWGYDSSMQATPPEGNDFVAIAAGAQHSLALREDGSIAGWGLNGAGEATPPEGNDFIAIAAGDYHSLALKENGGIVGWGSEASPPAGNDFVAIAAGGDHSLALKADGTVVGWGSDWEGQATPPEGADFLALAAGRHHSLALRAVTIEDAGQWRSHHLVEADQANPDYTDPGADPGHRGIPNLMRYAFGLDAYEPELRGMLRHSVIIPPGENKGFLALTFQRQINATDLQYLVETSEDLLNWSTLDPETFELEVRPNADGFTETVTIRDDTPVWDRQSRFMRITVVMVN